MGTTVGWQTMLPGALERRGLLRHRVFACLPGQAPAHTSRSARLQHERVPGGTLHGSGSTSNDLQERLRRQRPALLGRPCPSLPWGLQRTQPRPLQGAEPAGGHHAAPEVPLPGDDQASTMYTALATGSYDEEALAAAEAAYLQSQQQKHQQQPTSNGSGAPTVQQQPPEPQPQQQQETEEPVAHRWLVVGAMCACMVLANFDKVNMSVAVIPMAKDLGWTAMERGLVSSAFFWGYSLTQIPAGWLSTSIGGARVLLAGVFLWSLGTLIAPPTARMGLLALCATRVFVGLGEGLAPSSVTNVMSKLIPEHERARAVTTVFGGLDVGSAVGLLLCGPLIRWFGWQSVFYLFAALGFVWCALWPLCRPEQQDPDLPYRMIWKQQQREAAAAKPRQPVPWGEFLKCPAVWAVIVAHFCYNWGYYTLLAWLPSYFEMALGLNVEKSSMLTLIPYIAMTVMTPFVGPVADGLVERGWSVTSVRKLSQAGAGPTTLIVGIMSLAFALGAWARAGLYCNHQDLSPKYAAALLGLSNTAGALPGVLGVTAAGYLFDKTGSWGQALFYPTAVCQLVGLVIYSIFASSKRQAWE